MLLHDLIYGQGNPIEPSKRRIPVHSFDLETTGLDHPTNRTWSAGLAASDPSKSFESFIGGIIDKDTASPIYDFMKENIKDGSKVFAEKQLESGSFNNYFIAHHNTKSNNGKQGLESMDSMMNKVGNVLKESPGIFLVQNLPFEQTNTKEAAYKTGDQNISEATRKSFATDVFGKGADGSPIQTDTALNTAKIEFNVAIKNQMKLTGAGKDIIDTHASTEALKKARTNLDNTIAERTVANFTAGFSTPVDQMDITKLYLTDLHLQGGLDPGFLKTGTKIDNLAQIFLSSLEKHEALSDAEDQTGILELMNKRRSDLNVHGMSDADKRFVANLTDPKTDAKFFMAGVNENLQKMDATTTPAEMSEALNGIVTRRKNVPSGGFGRQGLVNSVVDDFESGTSIEDLMKRVSSEATEDFNVNKYATDAIPRSNNQGVVGATAGKQANWKSKVLMGGAAMVGVGLLASGPQRSKEEAKEKTEVSTYNELYDNVYAGQAYADWQQRNNAHKMRY